MKSIHIAFWLTCLLSLVLPGSILADHDLPATKSVLLLFPYQSDLPHHTLASKAIHAKFAAAADLTFVIYEEYLDLNRFDDTIYQQQLMDLLTTKYSVIPLDLVLVADITALDLWLEVQGQIAPDTPVVFYDVTTQAVPNLPQQPGLTGVSAEIDYRPSIEWILSVRPAIEEVVIVHGVSASDQTELHAIATLYEAFAGRVRFTDLSQYPLEEILVRVAELPETSIVLYHLMFADAAGSHYRPFDALSQLASASSVPVLCGYDPLIGAGAIGGYMYSVEQQAIDASQIGLRILRGESANDIPITDNHSNRFVFDHFALQRFDIPLTVLPPDSLIKNRQYSLWERYQPQFFAITAGFILLLMLLAFLLGLTRQLTQARRALAQLNVSLETQVQERTTALLRTNEQLSAEITERLQNEETIRKLSRAVDHSGSTIVITDLHGNIEFVNPAFEKITGYTKQEALGQNPRILKSGNTPPEVYADLWETIKRGEVWQGELLNRKKNGELYWENATISQVRDAQGNPSHYVAIKDDITVRKQAEETLRQYTKQLEELQVQLSEQAIRDPLTGAYNRRFFIETLQHELARSTRGRYPVSLLMIDVDHFKRINDSFGHLIGDQALKHLVSLIGANIRKSDVLCRYGGEEFIILMPQTATVDALRRAEEWRQVSQNTPITVGGTTVSLTISIGIATTALPGIAYHDLLSKADQALYAAKQAGRNCVRSAS